LILAWLNLEIPTKSMPQTINKSRRHKSIGGVFSSRDNADKAILRFRDVGISEEDIHVVVSLYDETRQGKILVMVHNVRNPSGVIEIFDDNHADYNLDGSRNVRHDVTGLTVGVAAGASVGVADGTAVGGPAGTVIGAAVGAGAGGGVGAAVGKVNECLK
jgi:hypothetical protein